MKHIAFALSVVSCLLWMACEALPPVEPPVVLPPFEPSPSSITYRLSNVDGEYLKVELLDGTIYREVNGNAFEVEAEGPLEAQYPWPSAAPIDLDAAASRDA